MVLFLGLSGCRFSEMAALTVGNVVDSPYGMGVRVHRAAPESKRTSEAVIGSTKTHRVRAAPVSAAVIDHVIARRAEAEPRDWPFPTPAGRILTNTDSATGPSGPRPRRR